MVKKITDTALKGWLNKRQPKKITRTLGDGLMLVVTTTGRVTFYYRDQTDGDRRVKVGDYPQLSLRAAKIKAASIMESRRGRRTSAASILTVDELYEHYVETNLKTNVKGWKYRVASYYRYFSPVIGRTLISELDGKELQNLFKDIAAEKGTGRAGTLYDTFKTFLNACVPTYLPYNPITFPRSSIGTRSPYDYTRLVKKEIGLYWVLSERLSTTKKNAFRMLLLTGNRSIELRLAAPNEFDLEGKEWVCPKERNKNLKKGGGDIVTYLTPLMIKVIKDQLPHSTPSRLFPPVKGEQINIYNIFKILEKMAREYYPSISHISPHDMRRTITNWAVNDARPRFSESAADRVLDHVVIKGSSRHYLVKEHDPETVRLYEAFSEAVLDYAAQVRADLGLEANVTRIYGSDDRV